MSDILERLRKRAADLYANDELAGEAAKEIEQLRVAAKQARVCLAQLLPTDPDAAMTVRLLYFALKDTPK